MTDNLLLQTDSYKLTHWDQYPPSTTGVFSYFESRPGAKWDRTLFFGLQYLLRRYLEGPVVDLDKIDEAEELVEFHLGNKNLFNRAAWEHIRYIHDGRLPLKINAIPEGTVVPVGNALMTVENTDPECFWLVNYLETLLTHVWYPSTVATLSWHVKQMLRRYLLTTGSDESLGGLDFMLHDFGYRGATSEEAAGIGGAAHLINFKGTDTLAAMRFAHEYYDAAFDDLAFSVPATEHSIMTARGVEGELAVLDQVLANYQTGIVSVVSDSYDIYAFVDAICQRKEQILARDGVFVVRPDSTTDAHKSPAALTAWIVRRLDETFGSEIVRSGSPGYSDFRALNPKVRVLWGDGINPLGIQDILETLKLGGYSAENMVFGMGGGLLQKVNRDTQRFAFKASAQRIEGEPWREVRKTPLDLAKASKGGRLKLVQANNPSGVATVKESESGGLNLLHTVFDSGVVLNTSTFDEVRARARATEAGI